MSPRRPAHRPSVFNAPEHATTCPALRSACSAHIVDLASQRTRPTGCGPPYGPCTAGPDLLWPYGPQGHFQLVPECRKATRAAPECHRARKTGAAGATSPAGGRRKRRSGQLAAGHAGLCPEISVIAPSRDRGDFSLAKSSRRNSARTLRETRSLRDHDTRLCPILRVISDMSG